MKQKSKSPLDQGKSDTPTQVAAKEPFLPVIRELARAYQAFSLYSDRHIRQMDLTPAQFDVIATLGNTEGLCMSELADKTLITKGTITGVIDRLEQKELVRREVPPKNRRSFTIVLTPKGKKLFETIFPSHIAYLKDCLKELSQPELDAAISILGKLHRLFDK
jgi:MarR family transcriptional regulator, 2-MHQ and catechol-resistance regulon repressor